MPNSTQEHWREVSERHFAMQRFMGWDRYCCIEPNHWVRFICESADEDSACAQAFRRSFLEHLRWHGVTLDRDASVKAAHWAYAIRLLELDINTFTDEEWGCYCEAPGQVEALAIMVSQMARYVPPLKEQLEQNGRIGLNYAGEVRPRQTLTAWKQRNKLLYQYLLLYQTTGWFHYSVHEYYCRDSCPLGVRDVILIELFRVTRLLNHIDYLIQRSVVATGADVVAGAMRGSAVLERKKVAEGKDRATLAAAWRRRRAETSGTKVSDRQIEIEVGEFYGVHRSTVNRARNTHLE